MPVLFSSPQLKQKPSMKKQTLKWTSLAATAITALAGSTTAQAQSQDALLNKLVEKGLITDSEAKNLRKEADSNFTKAYQTKSAMPDWVTSLKIYGDLRLRYEGIYSDNAASVDRSRFRYRLRPGITAVLKDNFEVGMRLTSSEASGSFGGDPISGNTTLKGNGSKKFIYLDTAYAKWNAVNTSDWAASFTGGKMDNPFHFPSTDMFDKDYTPEGFAGDITYKFNKAHTLKLTGAAFALDELSTSGKDPYLVAEQLRWNAMWSPHLSTSLGGGLFSILNRPQLTTIAIPSHNQGNTRPTATGAPQYGFNTFVVDAGVTYLLDSFPAYKGSCPFTVSGDWVYNSSAPQNNQAYTAGFTLGKSGKRGAWQMDYRWTELQSDAWFEEFTESDFGAYYQSAPLGGSKGYVPGSNVKGHWVKLGYSPYDSLTLSIAYFATELVHPNPSGSQSHAGRLQVDAVLKF